MPIKQKAPLLSATGEFRSPFAKDKKKQLEALTAELLMSGVDLRPPSPQELVPPPAPAPLPVAALSEPIASRTDSGNRRSIEPLPQLEESRGLLYAVFTLIVIAAGLVFWGTRSNEIDARVRINSVPPGAEVQAQGRSLGKTPLIDELRDQTPGSIRVYHFSLEGHEPLKIEAQIVESELSVDALLVPIAAPQAVSPAIEQLAPPEPRPVKKAAPKPEPKPEPEPQIIEEVVEPPSFDQAL